MLAIIKSSDGINTVIINITDGISLETIKDVINDSLVNEEDYAENLLELGLITNYEDMFYDIEL